MPIVIGKWLIYIVLLLGSGGTVWGRDIQTGVLSQLSPSGSIASLAATEYLGTAVVVYNYAADNQRPQGVYIARLEDGVAWYAPFYPAADMQLTNLTVAAESSGLRVCGWHGRELHCWYGGSLSDTYPYFGDFKYGMRIASQLYLPIIWK